MKTLSEDLRQDLADAGDEPLRFLDPASGKEYVLIQADVYERIKWIFRDANADFDPRENYASILNAWDKDEEDPGQYMEYLQDE